MPNARTGLARLEKTGRFRGVVQRSMPCQCVNQSERKRPGIPARDSRVLNWGQEPQT